MLCTSLVIQCSDTQVTASIKSCSHTRYLLGLTITTGAVVSLPFLYYSDTVVKKVGRMRTHGGDGFLIHFL